MTGNQRMYTQCVRYPWMHQEAQTIATLRKPNGRGQPRSERTRSNKQQSIRKA